MRTTNYGGFLAALNDRRDVLARCPDGEFRPVLGFNSRTGDVIVSGWAGDVWLDDATAGTLRLEFTGFTGRPRVWVAQEEATAAA